MERPSHEIPLGKIKLEDHLPEVFRDDETREMAVASLDAFRSKHAGELPLKFRIEEFCFNREEQICTADTARKYLAWAANDTELSKRVFSSLVNDDVPVVLRSHPIEYGLSSPTFQAVDPAQIVEHAEFLSGVGAGSKIQTDFFDRIDSDNTVVQLIKNAYPQAGLFLVRPTFVYDESLRDELRSYENNSPQYLNGEVMDLSSMPAELASLRIVPLDKFAREKIDLLGAMLIFNPKTGKLEARDGFPYEAKWQMEGAWTGKDRGLPIGRTIDLPDSSTTLHYDGGITRETVDSAFLSEADLVFLSSVLSWQMPRIANFENEIREQTWIPQGLTSTHQFIVFPPQELADPTINTQYFDFRAHESRDEMNALTGGQFDDLSTQEKIKRFF